MLTPDYSLQKVITSGEEAQQRDRLLSTQALGLGARAVSSLDAGWDDARRAWNLAADQRPEFVAFPESAEEVVKLVNFAAENGLRVAPQATGHGAAALGALRDAILVKTERLDSISIDPAGHRATVGAGVTWSRVQEAAAEFGLAGLAGSSPDVGVVGYSVGGGIGWLARKFGLACNSVLGFEVVTSNGEILRVDAGHEPDLFWALRGGGGSFGIVTAVEFALYPIGPLYAGMLLWPQDRATEVLSAWSAWVAEVPDSVTSLGRLLNLPPVPAIPEPLRGRSFVGIEAACLTSEREGVELVDRLRALGPGIDTFAMIEPAGLGRLHMDPTEPVPAWLDGWLLSDLPAAGITALVSAAGPGSGSSLVSVEIRHLGGALAESSPLHGALDTLDARFAVATVGSLRNPDAAAEIERRNGILRGAIAPWLAERNYRNFGERARGVADFHFPETVAALRKVRMRYDPVGIVLAAHAAPTA
jgi:FAD/FMN-containing dehydrogenase